jgi:hypothetical protein
MMGLDAAMITGVGMEAGVTGAGTARGLGPATDHLLAAIVTTTAIAGAIDIFYWPSYLMSLFGKIHNLLQVSF